jgi:hypothetical protein
VRTSKENGFGSQVELGRVEELKRKALRNSFFNLSKVFGLKIQRFK